MSKSEVKPTTTKQIIKEYNSLPADISQVEWVLYGEYNSLKKENERLKLVAEGNLKISLKHQDKNIEYLKRIEELKARVGRLREALQKYSYEERNGFTARETIERGWVLKTPGEEWRNPRGTKNYVSITAAVLKAANNALIFASAASSLDSIFGTTLAPAK